MRSRSAGPTAGRRRFLDHLLVAPLHRAVALAEVDRVAMAVGEDLDLDVARLDERPLEDDFRIAEGALRLRPGAPQRRQKLPGAGDQAHAAPAATGGGLDHHRVADRVRRRLQCGRRSGRRPDSPGCTGTPASLISVLAPALLPIAAMASGDGPDEDQAGVAARPRQSRRSRPESHSRGARRRRR